VGDGPSLCSIDAVFIALVFIDSFRVEIVLAAAVHLPLAGAGLNRSGAIRLNEVVAGRNIPTSMSFVKYHVS
jgi:hypothetical protein